MGQTGCPHDGKVVSTTHPYLGALAGYLGCSLGRLHTRPGAPWEHCDGVLGSPLYPPAAVLRHKAMACGPSSSRVGTAGPELASPATHRPGETHRARGERCVAFSCQLHPLDSLSGDKV